jgi:hypothetical protein
MPQNYKKTGIIAKKRKVFGDFFVYLQAKLRN